MTAYGDVISWAEGRPWWQQRTLVRLAAGDILGNEDHEALADALLEAEPDQPAGGWLGSAQQPAELPQSSVRLLSVFDVANVNRLAADQRLSFGRDGMTVVYGNNGSGKSGYARLVKRLVRARHQEQVLPDIFSAGAGALGARLEYQFGDTVSQAAIGDAAPIELLHVSYYDERCGDMYVTTEGAATYRPSALRLLDGLVGVCDGIRGVLDRRLAANAQEMRTLPAVDPSTRAAALLNSLSGGTTDAQIDAQLAEAQGAPEKLQAARDEEIRLRATDLAAEVRRLSRLANALSNVATHLAGLESRLGPAAEQRLSAASVKATETARAARLASQAAFGDEPLNGVGSVEWQSLWAAAERYSREQAYPHTHFPVAEEEAHCVLCQQTLGASAQARLLRFQRYMVDDTQAQSEAAAGELASIRRQVDSVDTRPGNVLAALSIVEESNPELSDLLAQEIDVWTTRKNSLSFDSTAITSCPSGDARKSAEGEGARLMAEAGQIDAATFEDRIQKLLRDQSEWAAAVSFADVVEEVRSERDRLSGEAALKEARRQTDTRGISRTSGELTAQHVTVLVQDRFSRESQDLRVDSVTLLGQGVRHGAVMHKPGFVGAVLKADLPQVLSEGEQTALGLAGFFVEAHLDPSRSAIVLDDPVTSLDHLRRDVVAERLARFAKDRQVIVFTHDVSFAASLKKRARSHSVSFTERSIERSLGDDLPGITQDKHPWSLKDSASRIDQLRADLARMKKQSSSGEWTQDDYDEAVSKWAGRLSQTWERIVSQEIADQLFDRSTLHVSITMMKIARQISDSDDQELQDSYNLCSGWTRHDQDMVLNYSPPSVDDLERELNRADAWFRRVKGYRTK